MMFLYINKVARHLVVAHKKGVDVCRKASEIELIGKADIVVVSPGGHPRDRNLYQVKKLYHLLKRLVN